MTEEERENSRELLEFIRERNGELESPETLYAINQVEHPQLDHITFIASSSSYDMWDKDGTFFTFKAHNYDEEIYKEVSPSVKKLYKRAEPPR